jgi:hypothetical protein
MHKDLPLIVAHLLGGTSGLNLQIDRSPEEVRELVARALKIALEIERQTLDATLDAHTQP